MNNIRLIVTDMDGTFLGLKGALLAKNGAAFRRAADAGIHVAFASGRLPCVLSRFARDLQLPGCHILGLNGGHVLDRPFGETLKMHRIPEDLRDACMEIILREGVRYNVYTDEGVYTNRSVSPEAEAAFRRNFSDCGCNTVIHPHAADFAASRPCLKLMVRSEHGLEAYERARAAIAALPGLDITTAAAGTFEVMPAGIDKAAAIRELAESLGISMDDVMAFGDFDNDVSMLSACGHSVAMGNASPAALAASRYQTLTNIEFGVAHGVDMLLAGNLEALRITGRTASIPDSDSLATD